jgi:hypothetical protein
MRLEVPYTDGLLTAIDIKTLDQRVLLGSGRDTDLNLGVFTGEGGEGFLQEGATKLIVSIESSIVTNLITSLR